MIYEKVKNGWSLISNAAVSIEKLDISQGNMEVKALHPLGFQRMEKLTLLGCSER